MNWYWTLFAFALAFNLTSGAINLWQVRRWYKLNAMLFNCIMLAWIMRGWRVDRWVYEALHEEEAQKRPARSEGVCRPGEV